MSVAKASTSEARRSVHIVGVIPAAGQAVRLQPLDRSKEVLEVGGRPVVEYLVERMRAGGADELRVVTRPEKEDVVSAASAAGARVILGRPPDVGRSIALALEGLASDDIVLIGFPDTIWEPKDGFERLVGVLLRENVDVALGLFRTSDLSRSDVVVCDDLGRVTAVAVKPVEPPSDLIWGCAAARVRSLAELADSAEPGHLFDRLARSDVVRGIELSTDWIDVGTPDSMRAARRRMSRAE